jgi:hypothetical protein
MSVLYIKGKDGKFVPIFTVKGADGSNGIDGAGVEEIKYKRSEGLVDTYEITYTDDRQPTYFTVTNGKTPEITIGDNGNWYIDGKDTDVKAQGEDGVSPTVEIFEITGGTRVAITDETERHEFDVLDGKDGTSVEHRWEGTKLYITSAGVTSSADLKGEKGDTGKGFAIKKVYQSYDEMVDDVNGNDVEENEFVLISTDTEEPHNSQLYIKVKNNDGSFEYKFLNDLSGAQGIQGVGIQSIEKTAINGVVDTYTITYTDGNKTTFTVRNSENLNIENGEGANSIQQKAAAENYSTEYSSATGDNAVALNASTTASGTNSMAINRKTQALQYGCFASGGSSIAGRTEEEFISWIEKYKAFNTEATAKAGHIFKYNSASPNLSYVLFKGYGSTPYDYTRYESYATAMGDMAVAKGRGCVAMGVGSKVLDGYGAFSIGANSTVETDDLQVSGSLGDTNTVEGSCSYTIGTGNKLYGNFIHAIGWKNKLGDGEKSATLYAFGRENTIIGTYNYAFGVYNNVSGTYNYAFGGVPSTYGSGNTVSGTYNYAIGYKNIVDGSDRNYTFGDSNNVKGRVSAVIGVSNSTSGTGKFVQGVGLQAKGNNRKVVLGFFNAETNDSENNRYTIFEVGDGSNADNRYTPFHIYKGTDVKNSTDVAPLDYVAELKGDLVLSKGGNNGQGKPTGNARTLTTDNIICYDKLQVGNVTGANNNRKVNFTGISCEDPPSQPTDVLRLQDVGAGNLQNMYWHTVSFQPEANELEVSVAGGKTTAQFHAAYTFLSMQKEEYTAETFSKWMHKRAANFGIGVSMFLFLKEGALFGGNWVKYEVNVIYGQANGLTLTFNYPKLDSSGTEIQWQTATITLKNGGLWFRDIVSPVVDDISTN